MSAVALVVGAESRDHEVGAVHQRDRVEELAETAPAHDLAEVEDDAMLGRQREPLREAGAADDVVRDRVPVAIGDHRCVANDRVDRPAEDARQDRGVRVADGDHRVGCSRESSLVPPQEPLPWSRQTRHPSGLAVDVVRVVDDPAAEPLPKCHRLAERDDALGLPHVERTDVVRDPVGPGARHQEVARDLDRAAERLADPSAHRGDTAGRIGVGLGKARRGQEGQRLRLADPHDPMTVERFGRRRARRPARHDRDVVAGLGQGYRRLPRPRVRDVGVVDEDRDASGLHARTVAHGPPRDRPAGHERFGPARAVVTVVAPAAAPTRCIIAACPRWKP